MPFIAASPDNVDHLANLRRLVVSRWLVLGATALLVLVAPPAFDIPLPGLPLLAVIGIAVLFNGFVQRRLANGRPASAPEIFSQLLVDIVTLSALVFFSGGATNPLISLLLPPVAIAALTLPVRFVATIAGIAIAAYSLLMVAYLPLALPDATRASRLHLIGMWLTFSASAVMIASFIVRMTVLIRERDAQLAAAREHALRDERVMAMGTLAAGAAHELGTPLGTMALVVGELANDASLPAAAREDIALLRQQIGVCKQIITGLSRRAGAERLENAVRQPVDRWLDEVRQHWHAVRPQAGSRLIIGSAGPAPEVIADPRLEQAVLNLLNNAANATPQPLEIRLSWCSLNIGIDICDHGPGFPAAVLNHGGDTTFPPHDRGNGVGLVLTRSAIEQLGGTLTLINPDEGGAIARIELPLSPP